MKTDNDINTDGNRLIATMFALIAGILILAFAVRVSGGIAHCRAMGIAKSGVPWKWSGHEKVCELPRR